MSTGGFTLRKWHEKITADQAPNLIETNDDNLARSTETSDNGQARKEPVKVLGIPWDVDEDTLLLCQIIKVCHYFIGHKAISVTALCKNLRSDRTVNTLYDQDENILSRVMSSKD